jgi:hypothetical protein
MDDHQIRPAQSRLVQRFSAVETWVKEFRKKAIKANRIALRQINKNEWYAPQTTLSDLQRREG